ncbi:MAG: YcbK family protein [Longimicrobiales bacterium]
MSPVELAPRQRRLHLLERSSYRRAFDTALAVILAMFVVLWAWAVFDAVERGERPAIASRIAANPLDPTGPPEAAFLLDAALRLVARSTVLPALGASGAVRVVVAQPGDSAPITLPDSLPAGVALEYRSATGDTTVRDTTSTPEPGIWDVVLSVRNAVRTVPDLRVISLVPMTAKRRGYIGDYRIGDWPWEEGGTPRSPAYRPPRGLIRVALEDVEVPVSTHFTLGDFLTKGQQDVWPKYVAMSPRLLDKLELTIQRLEAMGHPVDNVGVISGFRTPQYNEGGGDPSGRGALSRHMYGDAMDFFVDNDGDGRMDDLDGNGRVDVDDARVMARAAEDVERRHPDLVGGIGIYAPTGGHAGFIHVDTRGIRARW